MNKIAIKQNNIFFSLIVSLILIVIMGTESVILILPTFIGILLLLETISYAIDKGDSFFHPVVFTSFILMWVLVFSPVISIIYKSYLFLPPKNINWNFWMGIISWFYVFCIIIFYIFVKIFLRKRAVNQKVLFNKNKVLLIGVVFLGISLLCQIAVYIKFGGIIGYMTAWTESRDSFDGLGFLFMFSEPFPILSLIVLCILIDPEKIKRPLFFIIIIFIIFFILKLFFGGFRGSRSNTVWGLFWFAGVIHLYFFRLKTIHFVIGLTFLAIFMNLYSLYKSFGIDAFSGNYSLQDTGRFEDNPTVTILLNDFSRAPLHAYLLSQYFDFGFYDVKFGQTYLSAISKVIPFFNETEIYSKNSAGSEILYDRKSGLVFGDYFNSRIYGAYGEGLLNFGPFIAVLIFGIFSSFIVFLDNFVRSLNKSNPYYLMIPFLSNLSIMLLITDLDNIIFFILKNGLFIYLFIYLIFLFATKKNRGDSL